MKRRKTFLKYKESPWIFKDVSLVTEFKEAETLFNTYHTVYPYYSPHTSFWEEKKRNWGYDKFTKLNDLIEDQLKVKCVILEEEYSFSEMISLI